jgi:hypothetical protein
MTAALAPGPAERVYSLVASAARQPDVRAAVEANHDDNRWWPLSVADWRVHSRAVARTAPPTASAWVRSPLVAGEVEVVVIGVSFTE